MHADASDVDCGSLRVKKTEGQARRETSRRIRHLENNSVRDQKTHKRDVDERVVLVTLKAKCVKICAADGAKREALARASLRRSAKKE